MIELTSVSMSENTKTALLKYFHLMNTHFELQWDRKIKNYIDKICLPSTTCLALRDLWLETAPAAISPFLMLSRIFWRRPLARTEILLTVLCGEYHSSWSSVGKRRHTNLRNQVHNISVTHTCRTLETWWYSWLGSYCVYCLSTVARTRFIDLETKKKTNNSISCIDMARVVQ